MFNVCYVGSFKVHILYIILINRVGCTVETFFVDKSLSPNQMHPVPIILYYIIFLMIPISYYYVLILSIAI